MASNSTVSAVLNPNTPLAFLPPKLADQYQISCFVVVAGFSAYVWDWVISMPEEYATFRESRFRVPDIIYALSRIGAMGFIVSSTLFQVAPVVHCQALLYVIGSFYMLGMTSTSLLFFYRVRAVYGNSIIITGFFGFLWLATFGTSFVAPLSIDGDHIGPTNRCILTASRSYTFLPIVLNAIFDTLVFLAISYRIILHTASGDSWRSRAQLFFKGNDLPRLSKGLLQGGQLYYFATIGLNIVFAVMLLAPGIPAVYHSMLSVPNLAVENAMACRVHRAVKLGFIKDSQSMQFGRSIRSHSTPEESGHELSKRRTFKAEARSMQVNVEITRTTDVDIHDDVSGKRDSLVAEGSDVYDRV